MSSQIWWMGEVGRSDRLLAVNLRKRQEVCGARRLGWRWVGKPRGKATKIAYPGCLKSAGEPVSVVGALPTAISILDSDGDPRKAARVSAQVRTASINRGKGRIGREAQSLALGAMWCLSPLGREGTHGCLMNVEESSWVMCLSYRPSRIYGRCPLPFLRRY